MTMRFMPPIAFALLALTACRQQEAPPAASSPKAAIEAALANSAAAWNAGDQTRFMALYSNAADTSFVVPDGIVRGKSAIADYYAKAFAFSDPAKRGMLNIETLDFRTLGPDHALLIGRYHLRYPDQKEATGITSVVFRREPDGWKMIADHSS
jgi:uncharacterized protein (TIGR02246 family)